MTHADVEGFHAALSGAEAEICSHLHGIISKYLPEGECSLWHGHPVWFLNGNPIVGYNCLKAGIRLMFWSGQSFETPGLAAQGKFKAATITYTNPAQIELDHLRAWIVESRATQWDYKNIVKRKGRLERLC